MKKKEIAILFFTMTMIGVIFGLVLYWILISSIDNFLFHCLLIGGIFGLINSFMTLFFLKKYASVIHINQKLDLEVQKDKLTSLNNRHAFDRNLKLIRSDEICSIIFLDIDNFREYNNVFGHQVGDQVLIRCANIIKSCIRESDKAYRFGGEEFIIILNRCNKNEAYKIAQSVVGKIRDERDSSYPNITISAGVASMPEDSLTIENTIKASDFALLTAKKQGKNQVVIYDKTTMVYYSRDEISKNSLL